MRFYKKEIKMEKKYTLDEVILIFEKKITNQNYMDSVHKIKLMTTVEMLKSHILKSGILKSHIPRPGYDEILYRQVWK